MKKYFLYKNFIPESFVKKCNEDRKIKNKKSLILILISVILLLPNTITVLINTVYNNDGEYGKCEKVSATKNINDESFYMWMDIIKDDTVGTFNDNNAVLYIDGIENLQEVLNNNKIIITNVEEISDKKYKVQINLS